jgi:hypothetical protein
MPIIELKKKLKIPSQITSRSPSQRNVNMTTIESSTKLRHKANLNNATISHTRPIKVRRIQNLKLPKYNDQEHLPSITPSNNLSNNPLDESNLTNRMRVRDRHGYTTIDPRRDKMTKSTAPKRVQLMGKFNGHRIALKSIHYKSQN